MRSDVTCSSGKRFFRGLRFGPVLMRLRANRAKRARCWCGRWTGRVAEAATLDCTEFGQGPMDELHSIENRADRILLRELTLFLPSVDSVSFFDRFRTVFLVGGESGAQAQLTAVRTAKKAGIAGQRSWFRQAHAASAGIGFVSPNSGSHDGGSRAWGSRRRRPARRQTQQCVGRGGRASAGIGRRADFYSPASRVGKPCGGRN